MLRWKSSLKPTSGGGGGGGGGSTFPSTSLVGFYKLGEASGVDAADSSGNGYDFSDNGTVASTTGTIGGETVNVRTLDRPAGKYFSLSDTGAFDVGDGEDFTISFWAKVSSSMGNYDTGGIFSKRHNVTASDAGYQICLKKANSTTYVRYNAVCDGTTTLGDSNTDTGIATDAWAHYMMVFTADATLITYVNNAQYSSVDVSSVTGALTNAKDNYIGQLAYNNNGSIIADVTHLGFWKKALDSSERTALYNSGKVLAPAVAADITLETSAENEGFTGYNSPYNISVAYPAVSADDILLAIISTERRIDFDGTPPTDWTKVIETDGDNAFNPTQAVYWKRATGSAAATSETWSSIISGSQSYYAWVGAYSGCVTSVSPIDASAGVYQGYATSWSIPITTQTNNAMILAVAGSDSNTRTFVWSDGTELIDKVYQSTATVTINEKIKSTAGATTRSGTMSAGQSGTITAVSLRPVGYGYDPATSATNWWDASDESSITGTEPVTQIDDLIGAIDLTANGGPKSSTRTQNGLNVIDFDANLDYLKHSAYSTLVDFGIHLAVVIDSIGIANESVMAMDAATNDWQLEANSATQFDGQFLAAGGLNSFTLTGGPYSGLTIFSVIFDSATRVLEIYVNGVSRGSWSLYDSGDLSATVDLLFMVNRGLNRELDGAFCEAIIDSSTSNAVEVYDYLNTKWSP